MNIWQWVEQTENELIKSGNHCLVEFVNEIFIFCVNEEHAKVDALMPEALALTRQVNHSWLEIYFRHWHLQSRVLNRHEGKSALHEAVSLVEFAHREEAKDCPQTVCVIQDLSACYEKIDGPGFAEERKQVVKETLARINPSWPCFSCLSLFPPPLPKSVWVIR